MFDYSETDMAKPYNDTQFQVLGAVHDYWLHSRFGPTVEELREIVGLSVRSSVQWHIDLLVDQGFLYRTPKKHRSLRCTPKGKALVALMREIDDEVESEPVTIAGERTGGD